MTTYQNNELLLTKAAIMVQLGLNLLPLTSATTATQAAIDISTI
ncbi:hypothetical protein [Rheinheimera sp.]